MAFTFVRVSKTKPTVTELNNYSSYQGSNNVLAIFGSVIKTHKLYVFSTNFNFNLIFFLSFQRNMNYDALILY